MKAAHLLELASHLDGTRPDEFDMTTWAEVRPGCGTVCCALGHAAALFVAEGLRLKWDHLDPVPGDAAIVVYVPCEGRETIRYFTNYEAAAEFFGIGPWEVAHLFSTLAYRDKQGRTRAGDVMPHEVAARIREFVAGRRLAGVF